MRYYIELCAKGRDCPSVNDRLLVFNDLHARDSYMCAHSQDYNVLPVRNELVPVTYNQVSHKYSRDGRMWSKWARELQK